MAAPTQLKEKNIRNAPPNTVTGKYEDWDEFSFRLKSYINLTDPGGVEALTKAQNTKEVITSARLLLMTDDAKEVGLRWLAIHIFHQLIQLTQGPPYVILRGIESHNGLEAWRQHHLKYQPRKGPRAISKLT